MGKERRQPRLHDGKLVTNASIVIQFLMKPPFQRQSFGHSLTCATNVSKQILMSRGCPRSSDAILFFVCLFFHDCRFPQEAILSPMPLLFELQYMTCVVFVF